MTVNEVIAIGDTKSPRSAMTVDEVNAIRAYEVPTVSYDC